MRCNPKALAPFFGWSPTQLLWMINKVVNSANIFIESTVLPTEESLLVLKVDFDAGTNGNEMVTFWVNPDESTPV